MGPRLQFLDEDPQGGDGFSVVKIDADLGPNVRFWLEDGAKGDVRQIQAEVVVGKRVILEGKFSTFHVDDEFMDCKLDRTTKLVMECAKHPLMVLRAK